LEWQGATFSVVPFVNKKAIGSISGIVGAGGNVGAFLAAILLKSKSAVAEKAAIANLLLMQLRQQHLLQRYQVDTC